MKIFKTIIPGMMMASVALAKDDDLKAAIKETVETDLAEQKAINDEDELIAADLENQEAVNDEDATDLNEQEAGIDEDKFDAVELEEERAFEKENGFDAADSEEQEAFEFKGFEGADDFFAAIEAEIQKNLPEDATEEQITAEIEKIFARMNAEAEEVEADQ